MTEELDVRNLLARYIEVHNEGVLGGDTEAAAELMCDGLEIDVEGQSLSALRRDAIIKSFREHEVVLWKIGNVGDDVAFANYAWRKHPRIGGLIRLQQENGRIRRLTLRPGYSRIFGLLSDQSDEPSAFSERGGPDAFASPTSGPVS